MTRGNGLGFLLACLLGSAILPGPAPADDAPRGVLRKIGQPSREKYPGDDGADCWFRSVCDLQTYEGRVYVGSGWIGAQVGSTFLWSFGRDEVFDRHFSVQDEQVPSPSGAFRVFDGKLLFTGGDPLGSMGTLFLRDRRRWRMRRPCIPEVHKCGDAALFDGVLYVIKSPHGYGETGQDLVRSPDGGRSWSVVLERSRSEHGLYLSALGVLDDGLLVFGQRAAEERGAPSEPCLFRYRGTGALEPQSVPLCPSWTRPFFPTRIVRFGEGLLYTPRANRSGTEISRCPLYFLADLETGAALVPRFEEESVFDVLVREGTCYVLTAAQEEENRFRGRIHASTDLETWTLVTTFSAPALPFSMERLRGRFYVGLGNRWHVRFADAESGSIYRIDVP